jgi:hypothetical protein
LAQSGVKPSSQTQSKERLKKLILRVHLHIRFQLPDFED